MGQLADDFTEKLLPLVAEGNEHAALALCRVAVADDPDGEARAIIDETSATMRRVAEALAPFVEQWTAWVEGGIADAEDEANGKEP